ncbi:hypothetical protein GCM10023322_38940 [Rugosimonospora acidiphila]|uniref:Glycosyltransferase RgtA/B/C/D-like domain-containing protein n=1 Tax=Rugosimonospora acidiphila TaxID=556531 RepID=A0ABP9RYM2_9ACTN
MPGRGRPRRGSGDPDGRDTMRNVKSRWSMRHPYLILSALIVLLALVFSIRGPWSGDLGMHGATIEALRRSLTHPGNPVVDEDTPSPYYSPYTVLLAAVARLFGWSALTVLDVVSPINVLVLLIGLWTFVRTLSTRTWAPVLAIVFILLLWGAQPWVWSGFLSFWALPLVMAYPSTIALGLTLLWWTGLSRALDAEPRWYRYLGLGLLGAVIALTHQFTFVIAALGAVALVVSKARGLSRLGWLFLILAVIEVAGLILIWPYYSFFDLIGVSDLDGVHRRLYEKPFLWYGLCVVALPALWLRARRNRLDPLVLLFGMSALLVAFGGLTGKYEYGRVWPGVMLSAQLAIAVELAGPLPASRRVRRAWIPATVLACAVGLVTQAGKLVYLAPSSLATAGARDGVNAYLKFPDYSWATRYVHAGDVVLTDDYFAQHVLPGYGVRMVLSVIWPDPMLPDRDARRVAQYEMMTAKDPARRAALFRQYHVRWVLEMPANWRIPTDLAPVASGPNGEWLYGVDENGNIVAG